MNLALTAVQGLAADGVVISRGLKRRDTALIERLIEIYQHRLYRYLTYLTGSRERAEDLFQETWIRVLERGKQYNPSCRFDTWLFAIARHLVIDQARKKCSLSLEAIMGGGNADEPIKEFASNVPSAFEQARIKDLGEHLGTALMSIETVQREVILLRFQEELSLEEISSITSAPLSTVKSRLYRGLEALRPVLEEAGVRP
jgi:RNA polymerase sigma-70 factor (ECF subfamily)